MNKKYKFFLAGFLSVFFFFSFFQTSQAGFFDWFKWFSWFKKNDTQKTVEIIPIVKKTSNSSSQKNSDSSKSSVTSSKTSSSKSFSSKSSSKNSSSALRSSSDNGALSSTATKNFKEEKTAVILIQATDEKRTMWTLNEVEEKVFSSTDSTQEYVKELSYGKVIISGKVFGWYTMPIDTKCDMLSQVAAAMQLADGDIYYPDYHRIIFVLPNKDICFNGAISSSNFALQTSDGYISIPVYMIQSYSSRNSSFFVADHELIHTFGLGFHPGVLDCVSETLGEKCEVRIADPTDPLTPGGPNSHISGYLKERLGWLTRPNVLTVTQSGQYSIRPLAISTSEVQLLKIPKTMDAQGNTIEWYYIDYRQPIGFDKILTSTGGNNNLKATGMLLMNGPSVRLRLAKTEDNYGALLLDMTPGDGIFNNSALAVGITYKDPNGEISITTISADQEKTVLDIKIPKQISTHNTPTPSY